MHNNFDIELNCLPNLTLISLVKKTGKYKISHQNVKIENSLSYSNAYNDIYLEHSDFFDGENKALKLLGWG